MSIRLSSSDVSALVRASTVLLSPLSYENENDWQREACAAVQALVGGHASSSTLPVAGDILIGGEPDIVRVLQAIHPPAEWVSHALIRRRKDRQLAIADWSELFDVDKVRRSAFYNDVVRPNRLLASLNMMEEAVVGQLPAAISVYYRDEQKAAETVAEKKIKLQLILPAFRAGVRAYVSFVGRRTASKALAEAAPFGVALCDARGRVLDANGSLERLFAADSERDVIRREIARAAQSVTALSMLTGSSIETAQRVSLELRTLSSHYKVSAVALDEHWAGHQSSVAVLIEPIGPRMVDSRILRARYGLTPREIEIAQLLRLGLSSRQIAQELGISVNTIRRHVERILLKLDVHSRTAAAAKLSGTSRRSDSS